MRALRKIPAPVKSIILRLTHYLWNSVISRILGDEYSKGTINSRQLHLLAARFDPTQRHVCYPTKKNGGNLYD